MAWHLFAQAGQDAATKPAEAPGIFSLDPTFWPHLWGGLIGALVYGVLGMLLIVLGFKLFDWMMPRIDFERELAEKGNIAVAVVSAAIILGLSIIVAVVIN